MDIHVENIKCDEERWSHRFRFPPIMAALIYWGFRVLLDRVASMAGDIWATLEVLTDLATSFLVWLLGVVGVLQLRSFITFSSKYLYCVNFNKSKYVILALNFLRSSTIL